MKFGIIGAGGIGQALAHQLLQAGYQVTLSNSRGPESLAAVVRELGSRVRAGTREEAALADVVVLAVPWQQIRAALSGLPAWNGRILIDATNPVVQPGYRLADLDGSTSSEIVSTLAPGARVVKAANTLPVAVLSADPRQAGGRRVIFLSGNDSAAKADVSSIFERVGFATIDLGALATGGRLQQFPGGVLPTLNLIKLG
jgi:hypothetical protein